MDEQQWLVCADPRRMLRFLGERASARKLRLFACACCRRVWDLLTDARSRHAVEVAERYADGLAPEQVRNAARSDAIELDHQITRVEGEGDTAREMANGAAVAAADDDDAFLPRDGDEEDFRAAEDSSVCAAVTKKYQFTRATHRNAARRGRAQQAARGEELAAHAALVRDVFGNPFRPVALHPAWRTPDVLALAEAAYDERTLPAGTLEPARLALLADALDDAGCDNAEVLTHLRGPGPHVRGCWTLDLLLGKA